MGDERKGWTCVLPSNSHRVGIDLQQVPALEAFVNEGRAEGRYEIERSEEREDGEPHRGEQRGKWWGRVEQRSNNEP